MAKSNEFGKFGYNQPDMTTTAIRQKLVEYIQTADDKKIKAIYALVAPDDSEPIEWWQDAQFVADLQQQAARIESGEAQGTHWEDMKRKVLQEIA
jgi:hypothetical protein